MRPEPVRKLTPNQKRHIKALNQSREASGLSPIKIKIRRCICCKILFEATSNYSCGCISKTIEDIADW